MRLSEAVGVYVSRRRALGAPFVDSENILRSFCRYTGDIELEQVNAMTVSRFLDKTEIALITRAGRFSVLKCFYARYDPIDPSRKTP
jgi:hypothetical protein